MMKNIHILPTDKPTTLFKDDFGNFIYSINMDQEQNHFEPQHIYITSDEEIKEGDWIFNEEREPSVLQCIGQGSLRGWNKIILTTDQDLIKDGVQAIDDEFLEWFIKNPSCEWVEIISLRKSSGYYDEKEIWHWDFLAYKIIIPKEEPEQETVGKQFYKTADMVISVVRNKETLEEAAENYVRNEPDATLKLISKYSFKDGAKWQAERMYSEEEVLELILKSKIETSNLYYEDMKEWFEEFKKK